MATVLKLIDAEVEAFDSNAEAGSLDDKSPSHSLCQHPNVAKGQPPGCRVHS
jgi:hypothetical protein